MFFGNKITVKEVQAGGAEIEPGSITKDKLAQEVVEEIDSKLSTTNTSGEQVVVTINDQQEQVNVAVGDGLEIENDAIKVSYEDGNNLEY
jgi:hypothetical protein